jgi:hypothetical protein
MVNGGLGVDGNWFVDILFGGSEDEDFQEC